MRAVYMLPFGLAYAGLILHLAGTPAQTRPDSVAFSADLLPSDNYWNMILKPAPAIQHGLKIKRPNVGTNPVIEQLHK